MNKMKETNGGIKQMIKIKFLANIQIKDHEPYNVCDECEAGFHYDIDFCPYCGMETKGICNEKRI